MGEVHYSYYMDGENKIEWESIFSLTQWIVLVPTTLTLLIDIFWPFLNTKQNKRKPSVHSTIVNDPFLRALWCIYVVGVFLCLAWVITA